MSKKLELIYAQEDIKVIEQSLEEYKNTTLKERKKDPNIEFFIGFYTGLLEERRKDLDNLRC